MSTPPPDVIALTNRAAMLARQGSLDEAVGVFRDALAQAPNFSICRANLAHALLTLGEWDTAVQEYTRAIHDGYTAVAVARRNIGLAKSYMGDLRAALPYFDDPTSQAVAGAVLLTAGCFKEGWPLFEHRGVERASTPTSYWNGEDLSAKTIFVWPESVLGDHLIFGAILPDLIAAAGKVIIECKPTLYPIFKRSFPTATVLSQVEDGQPVPIPEEVDYQTPLNSLGLFFRPDFASFPKHSGYLRSDETEVRAARRHYEHLAQGRRIVGLGWRSKNELYVGLKCSRLIDWEPILKVPSIFFVSLLTGDWHEEVEEAAAKLGVPVYRDDRIVAGPDVVFAHAAAMDLVISTSNTVIHAAGTQNIPGWLILPRGVGAFWYWFNDREDSPWYPSLRLFRRARGVAGENWWRDPLERAAAALARWAPEPSTGASK